MFTLNFEKICFRGWQRNFMERMLVFDEDLVKQSNCSSHIYMIWEYMLYIYIYYI